MVDSELSARFEREVVPLTYYPKPLPTACKPRHHGSSRTLHRRCDLLVTESLDIGVVNNLARCCPVW